MIQVGEPRTSDSEINHLHSTTKIVHSPHRTLPATSQPNSALVMKIEHVAFLVPAVISVHGLQLILPGIKKFMQPFDIKQQHLCWTELTKQKFLAYSYLTFYSLIIYKYLCDSGTVLWSVPLTLSWIRHIFSADWCHSLLWHVSWIIESRDGIISHNNHFERLRFAVNNISIRVVCNAV